MYGTGQSASRFWVFYLNSRPFNILPKLSGWEYCKLHAVREQENIKCLPLSTLPRETYRIVFEYNCVINLEGFFSPQDLIARSLKS